MSPRVAIGLTVLVLASGCEASSSPGGEGGAAADSSRVPEAVARDVAAGLTTRVIVVLDRDRLDTHGAVADQLTSWVATDRVVKFAGAKQDLFAAAPAGLEVTQDFDQLPMASATLHTQDALDHLVADARVLRVVPDVLNTMSLAQSLPLINQPAAALDGKDGTGTAIAVLDTGADYRVADLGSCTAVGTPASCRVVYAQDFAVNDGLLDDSGKHGTNTSSISAAVAPGAKIIALDVFDGQGAYTSVIVNAINWVIANRATYNIASMNLSLGGGSYTTRCDADPMAIALSEARKVGVLAAVATGNSATTNAISSPACASAAVSVGAVYDSNVGPLNSSVCSDATSATDKVTCFSNSASFMTLLAPGAFITAGGVTMAGTSQATPHVAGALAVLHGAFPTETPNDLVARLVNSGKPITDQRNGLVVPRLDLAAAAAGCVLRLTPASSTLPSADSTASLTLTTSSTCAWSVSSSASWLTLTSASQGSGSATLALHVDANPGVVRSATVTVSGANGSAQVVVSQGIDTTAPTGAVSINSGATFTRTATVALTLTASDPSGVAGMCVTNGTTCTVYEPFNGSKAWTLAAANGVATVRLFLKDTRGNVSTATTAPTGSITLDTALPSGVTLTSSPGDGSVSLTWTAGTDATSGIATYRVVAASGATAPASCSVGTTVYEGPALTFTQSGLANGATMAYRVCAIDRAGNVATGVVITAMPKPESVGPVGSVSINAGAAVTATTQVTLTIGGTDASAITQMCVSSTATCAAWETYASSKSYTLVATQGLRTVSVWLKDVWGNVSASPATASITYDSTPPTAVALTAAAGDATVALSWTAATDATSGLAKYRVVYAVGAAAPASCSTGLVAYEGTAQSFTQSGLTNGTTYAYRACGVDVAGNIAAGVTATAMPKPESVGPIGTIVINSGAIYTNSTVVTLALSATDASQVTSMCLSSTTSCTAWEVMASSKAFTLPATQGTRTVYAFFRDQWGNVSASPAQDSIVLDTTAPTNGTLTASWGDSSIGLSWSAVSDATSGVAKYRVVAQTGTTAPASCAVGTVIYEGTALSTTHTGLTNGTTLAYRVCGLDGAGNVATGSTASAMAKPEAVGPTGSVSINGGAAWTRSTAVTLALTATDASKVSSMCVSNTTTCTAWETFSATKAWTLVSSQGARLVSVWFRDEWGNVSTAAATASIGLDTGLPTGGALTATSGDTSNSLAWTAATDATSGVVSYVVVFATGATPPASCTAGTVASSNATSPFVHTGLVNGTQYSYRVCAVDAAGNVANGMTGTAQPRPESLGPVGTITLNAGAPWTNAATVTATLSATDASAVTQVCVSTTSTCSVWVPWAATVRVALPATTGQKTVFAWFQDVWGNLSSAVATATIGLDLTVPTQPALTGVAASKSVVLSWASATDVGSGVVGYRLVTAAGTTPPATCATGTVLSTDSRLTFTQTGLTGAASYAYRLCSVDAAGNVSAGATVVVKTLP